MTTYVININGSDIIKVMTASVIFPINVINLSNRTIS